MDKELNDFLDDVKGKLSARNSKTHTLINIHDFPLQKGQCFYVFNFKSRKIEFQKGVFELLGYCEDEFTHDKLFNFTHPEDQFNVNNITMASVAFAIENDVSRESVLKLAYRIRKKSGESIKVMRQTSICELDEKGNLISNYTVLTDISFLNMNNQVAWQIEAPELEQEKFRHHVKQTYQSFFTKREIEILGLLKQGFTSNEIAAGLFISKHTVDTHRRKMLQKVCCENTIDLLNFYSQNVL